MALAAEAKAEIINQFQTHTGDTGSPEVQVALLTERINGLIDQIGSFRMNTAVWCDMRDRVIFEILYSSGLRVGELVHLNVDDIDRFTMQVFIREGKGRKDRVVPFGQKALDALERYLEARRPTGALLLNEEGGRLTSRSVARIVKRYGKSLCHDDSLHPHMLRHSAGYKLANDGQDTRAIQHYMGHKNIQHTVRYTELSPQRFKDFWRD